MTIIKSGDNGAVAAGHIETARIGAEILDAGGNAVDAVVAMLFAGTVVEGTLSSLGGGGFMLVDGPGIDSVMLDFFVRQPGYAPRPFLAPWESFQLQLDSTLLHFGTGPASVAVPGVPAGLAHASRRFGRLPLARVAAPAAELATSGVTLTRSQAVEHTMNSGLYSRNDDGRRIYLRPDGAPHEAGEIFRQPDLADTIEQLAHTDGRSFYDGEIARRLVRWSNERGGRIAPEDLLAFEVRELRPLIERYGDVTVKTNPRPAMGGVIITRLLAEMLQPGTGRTAHDVHVARSLVRVLSELRPPLTRPPGDGDEVHPDDLPAELHEAVSRMTPSRFDSSGSTTHVAALDSDGMTASSTATVGYGSGEFIPDTGIQLNNILAEYDHTRRRPAGSTVPSMMSPTLLQSERSTVAIGSAGSDRIPQAIAQILTRMWRGAPLGEAILAPRFVFDGERIHCEPGFPDAALDELGSLHEVVRWNVSDAYFGTSNGVALRNGVSHAQGDTRREGAGITR